MAANSILGTALRAYFNGGLAAEAVEMWWVAAPVTAFMAPFGAYVCSKLNLGSVRLLLYSALALKFYFVTTIITIKKTFYMFIAVSVIFVWFALCMVVSVGGSIRSSHKDDDDE